ncbi:MAG: hypothetical protein ABI627_23545 [Polyangiaceae bacterium]
MRLGLVCALCCAWLLLGSAAQAEQAATLIVLITDDPNDAVTRRLDRDLRGLGFGVVVLETTPENSSDAPALERTARSLGGLAAVLLLPDEQGSQLWVLEPTTNRSVTRELLRPAGSSPDPNEVALGTLELLRASMLELHPPTASKTPAPAPAPALTPPAPISAAAPDRPATLSLLGGVGVELGLRSVGPSLSTLWAAWLHLGGCMGARGFAALPLVDERSRLPEGDIEVRPSLFGVGLSCGAAQRGWLRPHVGLGIAMAHVETRGTAPDPRLSHRAAAWLGGGYGLLGVGLRLAHHVQLDLDATGVVLPAPAIIFAQGREVATWGAPGVVVSLGLEVGTNL